jgi:hypothetical protein
MWRRPARVLNSAARCAQQRLRPDEALHHIAADFRAGHPDAEALPHAIADFVYGEMIYTKGCDRRVYHGSVAFSMRRGVCQEYAHIAIALSRVRLRDESQLCRLIFLAVA